RVHGRLDILHPRKALAPHHFLHVGIYGHNVVSTARKFLEHHFTHTFCFARHSHNRNPLLSQEVLDRLQRCALNCHGSSSAKSASLQKWHPQDTSVLAHSPTPVSDCRHR